MPASVVHATFGPFTDYASEQGAWEAAHTVTGLAPDTPGDFDAQTGVALSTLTTSNSLTLSAGTDALDRLFPVKVIGDGSPELQVNSEGWGRYGAIRAGDTVTLRLTSSSDPSTENVATLLIDSVADADCPTFSVTTTSTTVYADDDLNAGDGTNLSGRTPLVGSNWIVLRGTWQINANRAGVISDAGDGENVACIDCGAANVVITSGVIAGSSGEVRLAANITDADHLWLGYGSGTSLYIFQKTASGSYTARATGSGASRSSGTSYPCELKPDDDDIYWTVGGVTLHYAGSPRAEKSSTKHGIHGVTANTVYFDSFHVESL